FPLKKEGGRGYQLFSGKPAIHVLLCTGSKIFNTSASNCRSSRPFAQSMQFFIFVGLAVPTTQVVISGFSTQNRTASCAISTPLLAQCSAARRHAARNSVEAKCHFGNSAFVSNRALNGEALIIPTPFALRYGIKSSSDVSFSA